MERVASILWDMIPRLVILLLVQQGVTQQKSLPTTALSAEEIVQLQSEAEAGNAEAQVALGRAFEDGNGVPQSDRQAVKCYRAAAEQGNATAQNGLGLMLRSGRGVDQDKAEAVKWYKKAARQRNSTAMYNLGTAFYNGDGVAIDDIAANAWFLLAKDLGSQPAVDAVRRMEEQAKNLQPESFEKIGDMYQKGDDLPQSYSDAVAWYRKAAEEGGAPVVQVKLAGLLLQGGPSNYGEAHRLCGKAAQQKYSPGTCCIGLLSQQGLGVPQDATQAAKWFDEAANMGNAPAMLRLGEMYWKGEGVKLNKISAYEFIAMASTADLPEARREKDRWEKELSPEELKKGQAKAAEWARTHHPLVLRGWSANPN
jgi:uncharacterized protein